MLRDKIILSVQDKTLQLKLLDGKDDPLAKIIEKCKVYEAANAHKILLDHGTTKTVNTIAEGTVQAITRFCFNCGLPFGPGHMNICKAKDIICKGCNKKGHFIKMCRGKKSGQSSEGAHANAGSKTNNGTNERKQMNSIDWSNTSWQSSGNFKENINGSISSALLSYNRIYRINTNNSGSGRIKWTKTYLIGTISIEFKIDSGSDVNCIPIR